MLGSGGASFGIVTELINRDVSSIVVSNRTKEKSFELIKTSKIKKQRLNLWHGTS